MFLGLVLLAGCGNFHNPFEAQRPFVPSAVPDDLVIIVDENHDTFVNREHLQQVITAKDSMSRTTHTVYRDYNNSVADQFTQPTPLSPAQLQDMWNAVCKENVMEGSSLWINFLSDTDLHQRNSFIIQVRANGRERTYKQTNGFSGRVRPLMLLVSAVRLPMSQNASTPVVGSPDAAPMTMPAGGPGMPGPSSAPTSQP